MHLQKRNFFRRICCLWLTGTSLFCAWQASAAGSASEGGKAMTAEQKTIQQTITSAAAFRTLAMKDQTAAFKKLMTPGAFAAWQKILAQMDPRTGAMGVADFINTAVLLVGPQTPDEGVCALYSPFQDVILLLQTDNAESFSQVENFRFLPGAVFRGEKLNADAAPASLLPAENQPLTIALMQLFFETEKVFNQITSVSAPLAKYPAVDAAGIRYIEKVMDTRNRCALTILKEEHQASLFLALTIRTCMKRATAEELKQKLQPGVYQEQAESFAALPAEIREGMELCHWLTSPERDLYAFMNKLFPRFIAIVTADVKEENAKWTLEWFDIANAKELYPLYEKELAKQRK